MKTTTTITSNICVTQTTKKKSKQKCINNIYFPKNY